jgi:hypothetical protein
MAHSSSRLVSGASAAGMMPGIPKFRKESHPERAKDNEDKFILSNYLPSHFL